jgi:hypothetical protein
MSKKHALLASIMISGLIAGSSAFANDAAAPDAAGGAPADTAKKEGCHGKKHHGKKDGCHGKKHHGKKDGCHGKGKKDGCNGKAKDAPAAE